MVSHNEYSQNQYSTKYDRRFLFLMDFTDETLFKSSVWVLWKLSSGIPMSRDKQRLCTFSVPVLLHQPTRRYNPIERRLYCPKIGTFRSVHSPFPFCPSNIRFCNSLSAVFSPFHTFYECPYPAALRGFRVYVEGVDF